MEYKGLADETLRLLSGTQGVIIIILTYDGT